MEVDLSEALFERPAVRLQDGGVRVSSRHATRVTGRRTSPLVVPLPSTVPELHTGSLSLSEPRARTGGRWLLRYRAGLVALDALALVIGGAFGRLMTLNPVPLGRMPYSWVLALSVPAWLLMMAASRGYEPRCLGLGSEEFRRVGNAAARFTAILAVVVFVFRLEVGRGLVVLALPAASGFALVFRYLARQVLHRVRADGAASHRVLVVGEGRSRDLLAARLQASPHSGLRVVGVCRPVLQGIAGSESTLDHVRRAVADVGADTVAVAHSPGITPDVLRRMSWALEGTGVDLLVAPALTDVAGPRIQVRPVSGLPLLAVAEPEFTGVRRVAKAVIDAGGAVLLLVALSPLLAASAVAVRWSSPGPVLFRQVRIGRDGEPFGMYKFRSMYADAEARLAELKAHNDHGSGVLFKMANDPRITRVGAVLRRYSIDELPQLLNVLKGQMSLVGPRPPLPSEVAAYERDVHRRLLVKPGLTGLWQVSGRSDLDWDETVRLDLYYVENWSVALDAEILWKTLSAVLRGSGAR